MIPGSARPFSLSLKALAIILLAGALGILTWCNFGREEHLMGNFIRQEGITLIRTIKAGPRTSMMMN